MSHFLAFVLGFIYVELIGYWLHILIHSEKLPSLSRAHMLHHLRDYGPRSPLHRENYISSADHRTNILGFGMEWMTPILLIITLTLVILNLFNISFINQSIFISTGLFWGYFLFGYMHTSMHLKTFWMQKVPGLNIWYKHIRKLHDFHHLQFSDDGRMLKNYGICFFWFDRIFGSFSNKSQPFNKKGYEETFIRYKDILK